MREINAVIIDLFHSGKFWSGLKVPELYKIISIEIIPLKNRHLSSYFP
jgi:hypothetical protein